MRWDVYSKKEWMAGKLTVNPWSHSLTFCLGKWDYSREHIGHNDCISEYWAWPWPYHGMTQESEKGHK